LAKAPSPKPTEHQYSGLNQVLPHPTPTAITNLIQHLQPSRTSSNTYSRHVPHPTPTGVIGLGIGAAHVPHPTSTAVTVFVIGTSMVSAVNGTISTLFPGKSTRNVPSSNNLSPAVNAAAGWIAPESWAVSPVDGNGSVNTDVDKSKEDDRLVASDFYPPHRNSHDGPSDLAGAPLEVITQTCLFNR
jgi:hypothetical protein